MGTVSAILLVFVGCCTNVVFLELLVRSVWTVVITLLHRRDACSLDLPSNTGYC